jgi:hypothetical protein
MESENTILGELKEQFGTIYTITATNEAGEALVMYLKKPDYQTKKKALEILLKDQTNIITVGEILLSNCYVGGVDLYESEETRLEAALHASTLVDTKMTMELKKN